MVRTVYIGLALALFLLSGDVFGQEVIGKLWGRVIGSTGHPVRLATVALSKPGGLTQTVWQTLTDSAGSYALAADTGSYQMTVSCSGHESVVKSITVGNEGRNEVDVVLYPAVHNMKTITVKGRKPLIEQSGDKIIYNAESDPAAKTESASDLLRKTPFVTVDGEGNVQVNGQSDFKILLDGRPTSQFARNVKEALKAFPGAVISKIEVITSPSAKYDAEGSGGIINIVTKKRTLGYNASLTTTYNSFSKYAETASVNAKTRKIGVSAYVSTGGYTRDLQSRSFSETTALGDAVFSRRRLDGEKNHGSRSLDANVEVAYDFDSLNTVAVYGSIDQYRSNDALAQNSFIEMRNRTTQYGLLNQDNVYKSPGEELGFDWIRSFRNRPGKELTLSLNTQGYKDDETINTSQSGQPATRFVSGLSSARSREHTFQLDLVQPLKEKQKLEFGTKAIIRSASSDYQSGVKYDSGQPYLPDPSNSDRFNYHQSVYSLYASYSIRQGKNSLRAGLRTEHTVVNGDFLHLKTAVRQTYTNFIPALFLSRKFTSVYTLTAAYNLRLHRPSIVSLNPFVNNSDSLNVSLGNPALEPQILHAVSIQNRFSIGRLFAAFGVNAGYSGNSIVRYARFDPKTGVTSITRANIGKERQAGISLNLNAQSGEKFSVDVSSSLRYNKIENGADLLQRREGFSGSLSGNLRYKLAKKLTVASTASVSRSPYALVNSPSTQYYYQISFTQKLLNDKLAVTVNGNNFHHRYFDYKTETEDPFFRLVTINSDPFRVVSFGIAYNFGKLKEDVSKKKGLANDDRMQ